MGSYPTAFFQPGLLKANISAHCSDNRRSQRDSRERQIVRNAMIIGDNEREYPDINQIVDLDKDVVIHAFI